MSSSDEKGKDDEERWYSCDYRELIKEKKLQKKLEKKLEKEGGNRDGLNISLHRRVLASSASSIDSLLTSSTSSTQAPTSHVEKEKRGGNGKRDDLNISPAPSTIMLTSSDEVWQSRDYRELIKEKKLQKKLEKELEKEGAKSDGLNISLHRRVLASSASSINTLLTSSKSSIQALTHDEEEKKGEDGKRDDLNSPQHVVDQHAHVVR